MLCLVENPCKMYSVHFSHELVLRRLWKHSYSSWRLCITIFVALIMFQWTVHCNYMIQKFGDSQRCFHQCPTKTFGIKLKELTFFSTTELYSILDSSPYSFYDIFHKISKYAPCLIINSTSQFCIPELFCLRISLLLSSWNDNLKTVIYILMNKIHQKGMRTLTECLPNI